MMKLPKLPQLQPRERLLGIGAAVVLLVVLLDRCVLAPWIKHSRAIRQEIGHMEEALQNYERLLSRKEPILAEFARARQYLKPAVADDLQMAALLKEIQGLAEQSQVVVKEIKPLGVESDEIEKRYSLEVRFQCTLEEWLQFVYDLETSPSLYRVMRAGLSMPAEAPDRLDGVLRVMSAAVATGGVKTGAQVRGNATTSVR